MGGSSCVPWLFMKVFSEFRWLFASKHGSSVEQKSGVGD